MAKRFAALLLAVCLAMTCTLGAWAEGPAQTGSGQSMETVSGSGEASGEGSSVPVKNISDPTKGEPDNEEVSAPGEDEDTPDENESQEDESTAGGPEESSGSTGGPNDTTTGSETDNSEADGSETDRSEPDPDDRAGNDQNDIDLCSAPEDEQQKILDILNQYTVWPCIYKGENTTGTPADMNDIVANEPLTIYYALFKRDSGGQIIECSPDEVAQALGKSWSFVPDEASGARYGQLIEGAVTFDTPYPYPGQDLTKAYWHQTFTPTRAGSIELTYEMTVSIGNGGTVGVMSSHSPFNVREKSLEGNVKALYEAIEGLDLEWLENVSVQHRVTVGDTVTLALTGRKKGPTSEKIADVKAFIQELGLDPSDIRVEWSQDKAGSIIFEEKDDFIPDDAADHFGSQAFTVVAGGYNTITCALYCQGELIQTARIGFTALRPDEQIDITDAEDFPDPKLREALRKNYDTSADGKIDVNTEFNGELNLSGCGITDLTGLERFKDLRSLILDQNDLTTLDVVSKLKSLQLLSAYHNKLTELDVSGLKYLQTLNCAYNSLTTLDVTKNENLERLYCSRNQLEKLDVSKNTELTELDCSDNRLQTLDVGSKARLKSLFCNSNRLQTLDVRSSEDLIALNCSDNYLTELDLSANTGLRQLYVGENRMPMLDLTANQNISNDSTDLGPVSQGFFGTQSVNTTYTRDGSDFMVDLPAGVEGSEIITVCSRFDRETRYEVTGNRIKVPEADEWMLETGMLTYEYPTHGPGNAGTMAVELNARPTDWQWYKIVEGDKPSIVVDGETALTVVTDMPKEKVSEIYLNGPVPADQFDVEEVEGGNTKITIAASYLKSLITGYQYSLTIRADKGEASTTVYVIANTVPLPPAPADEEDTTDAPAPAEEDAYIICKACGHQTWEPYLDGWRCTNCGHLRGTTGVPAGTAAKTAQTAYRGTIPQTADEFPLEGVGAVFGISLAGLGALLLLRKKQR